LVKIRDISWHCIYNEGDISLRRSKLGQGYPINGKRLLECRGSIDRTVTSECRTQIYSVPIGMGGIRHG